MKNITKITEKYIKFGLSVSLIDGKKKVSGFPTGWQKLTESVYNGELNFGILTGEVNDIVVLDLDVNKDTGVLLSKDWFNTNFFDLDNISNYPTLVTRTISGGYHVYYKYNKRLRTRLNIDNLKV